MIPFQVVGTVMLPPPPLGAAIITVRVTGDEARFDESVAVTVKENVFAVVGAPLRTPVLAFNVSPGTDWPELDHVNGPVEPFSVAESVAL